MPHCLEQTGMECLGKRSLGWRADQHLQLAKQAIHGASGVNSEVVLVSVSAKKKNQTQGINQEGEERLFRKGCDFSEHASEQGGSRAKHEPRGVNIFVSGHQAHDARRRRELLAALRPCAKPWLAAGTQRAQLLLAELALAQRAAPSCVMRCFAWEHGTKLCSVCGQ